MRKHFTIALLSTLLAAPGAFAWGNSGHKIVARIAQDRLSDEIEQEVRALLKTQFMSSVATFADEFRSTRGGGVTGEWHFVDIDREHDAYDAARDCAFDDCVVQRIERMKVLLADRSQKASTRADALTFLIHFVGDMHQPFHCATGHLPDGSSDRGGNGVNTKFGGQERNLHSVWDSGLISRRGLSDGDYVQHLIDDVLADRDVAELTAGTTVDWANHAHQIAQEFYVDNNTTLSDDYIERGMDVVDEQLLRAGLRLQRIIEDALGGEN